jgi:hypothetical protein
MMLRSELSFEESFEDCRQSSFAHDERDSLKSVV